MNDSPRPRPQDLCLLSCIATRLNLRRSLRGANFCILFLLFFVAKNVWEKRVAWCFFGDSKSFLSLLGEGFSSFLAFGFLFLSTNLVLLFFTLLA